MFPDQKDFAVRTFGMPENNPFLGVCFGMVITANSPGANLGNHFNWESMLWHEFCHSVTLQLTRNKMPRWISEGISVYEERQANPAWGERMNPRYREMILGDDLTPIAELSGAFLAPKSPLHMQFAYFQSSLVVEFLVERFGREKLLGILRDLGQGMDPNEAMAKNTVPLPQLEKDFEAFARKLAQDMAPDVDWETPAPKSLANSSPRRGQPDRDAGMIPALPESIWDSWAKSRPTNYWVMLRKAERLADGKNWAEARPLLEELVQLYPGAAGPDSPYHSLALACRELGDTNAERQVLTGLTAIDDEAPEAYLRLMELAAGTADWPVVLTNAARYLAVDPLVPAPHRFLARASEALGDAPVAIRAYQALLQLDDPNPADVHFRLATLLHHQRDPQARRHVLRALEDAPRFREALLLLRQMHEEASQQTTSFQ
jgi:tetratricopeptide (TPR) repeat protein